MSRPKTCPNAECQYHKEAPPKFSIKKGYFRTKWNSKTVPMYQCKACGKKFSTHTNIDTSYEKRPDLDQQIATMHSLGISGNKMAIILKCNRKTTQRKIKKIRDKEKLAS
jgi:transposase-like protein